MVVSEVWIWCPSIRFSLSLSLNKYKTIKYDVDSADVIVYLIYFVSFCFGYPFGRIVDGSVRYRCAVCMILPVFGSSMSISNVCYTLFRLGNLEPNRTANDENEKKIRQELDFYLTDHKSTEGFIDVDCSWPSLLARAEERCYCTMHLGRYSHRKGSSEHFFLLRHWFVDVVV